MKIICIIQARSTSSRLPNKVLLKLPYGGDKLVLEQVIDRVKRSKKVDKIVIATTINESDNQIQEVCEKNGIKFYRGSEDNVLSRYYEAAKENGADLVMRITSDCPCIDSEILDKLIEKHLEEGNDYTSNTLIRSFPHGLDCEIFKFSVLEEAYLNAKDKFEIEHVTPYIYKSNPEKFRIGIMEAKENNHEIRITLDTADDYNLLCAVYDNLYSENSFFGEREIANLFRNKPWLFNLNNRIEQKKVCKNLEEEIEEAVKLLNKQDLNRAEKYLKEKFYGKV